MTEKSATRTPTYSRVYSTVLDVDLYLVVLVVPYRVPTGTRYGTCVRTQELPRPKKFMGRPSTTQELQELTVLGFPTVLHAVTRGWC